MDFRDTADEAAFRETLRAWLAANVPHELRGYGFGLQTGDLAAMKAWSAALHAAGYAGLNWPREYGGTGAPLSHQAILLEELARAEAPPHVGVIGLGMAGPTIMAHGSEAQKERFLAPLLEGREIWCQGFSEPSAGSDLAGVRTSCRVEAEHFVLDGQKVWSSYAHVADFCILLARSDPASVRHDGLTYVIVDMHAPGVEVRPLRQITGDAEFNEIFLTGVVVPRENLLGEIGGGWQVAMTTLLHERGTLGRGAGGSARDRRAQAARPGARPRSNAAAARRAGAASGSSSRRSVSPPTGHCPRWRVRGSQGRKGRS